MNVKATFYLDVISSWCYWAQPAWEELQRRYAGRVEFRWKIALMDGTGMPGSPAQAEWFYRRSGLIARSPFMLTAAWMEPGWTEYLAPNIVAEAAKDFGATDDKARLAIAEAGVRKGKKIGNWEVAALAACEATGLGPVALLARAQAPELEERVRASTREFHALKVSQRPTFVIEDSLEDRAVFSGLINVEPLAATIDAMLRDVAAYESHAAHFGGPPPA